MMFPPNLFRPGSGDRPPHLAGREREIMAVAPMEADLRSKRAPSADIVLHGPRGNGKTVLLDEIGGRLRQAGADVVNATPTDMEAANRYPYFIQEIGNALVTALNQATTKRIDAAVAKQALALFLPIRCDFYDNRRMELLQSGFLPHAEALAPIFADGKERLPFKTVEEALERHCAQRGDQPDPATVLQALTDRGLIWARAGMYEAGIPSLLTHLDTCATGNSAAALGPNPA